jgi:hypothetical protein
MDEIVLSNPRKADARRLIKSLTDGYDVRIDEGVSEIEVHYWSNFDMRVKWPLGTVLVFEFGERGKLVKSCLRHYSPAL